MTNINQQILDMISKNASVNEICSITGLSNKQLFYRLNMFKIKGFDFSRKYYSDGEICYKLNKGFTKEKRISLITKPSEQEFKAIFISDLHLCSEKERLDLLDQVYEFCVKEGIHVIINGGDLIDGLVGTIRKKFDTYEKQIDYALKKHPFDKNILNFICLGNHDYNSLETTGQDIETVLKNKRHDIICLGYGSGELNIKNDKIIVVHPGTPTSKPVSLISSNQSRLLLYGHGHIMKHENVNKEVKLYLPTLSDIMISHKQGVNALPSMVVATINFVGGYFNVGNFEQYVFLDKMYKVNESEYKLLDGKNINTNIVKYEEDRTPYIEEPKVSEEDKIKEKILNSRTTGMSQIEKFNQRYGLN